MRLWVLRLLIAATLCVSGGYLFSQTKIREANLAGSVSTVGQVWVTAPDGTVRQAEIDTASLALEIDALTGKIKLRAIAGRVPVPKAMVSRPSTATTVFVLSDAPLVGSISIALNGLALAEGIDYSVSADQKTITLLAGQRATTGDIVLIRYWL